MRFTLLVITICLFASGCNSDPRCRRETALLRAEILDLEDKYYLLKSERDSAVAQLSGVQGVPGEIVSEPYYSEGTYLGQGEYIDNGVISDGQIIYEGAPIVDGDVIYEDPITLGNGSIQTSNGTIVPGQISEPDFNPTDGLPNTMEETGSGSTTDAPNAEGSYEENDSVNYPDLSLNSPDLTVGYQNHISGNAISEVLINLDATRGHDVDGQPGDEGLDMLIQTRTPGGKIELQTGELTVSVVDPKQPPSQQRIGLWKFVEEEVELFFANDEIGSRGILLHLPWEQATPINSKLIAHVRFVTGDGKVFTTSSEIRIKPPASNYSPDDPLVSGWTQRDSRWIQDDAPSSQWRQNRSRNASQTRSGNQSPTRSSQTAGSRNLESSAARRMIPAKPASTKVPGWRPVR